MSFPAKPDRSSKRTASAEIRVLAELEGEILIKSPQGFLLIFRDRTPEMLARQLRYFDTDEWRDRAEMEQLFPMELEGLVERERMSDATDLFARISGESLAYLNQEILNISGSNVDLYNYIHSADPFCVKARIQAITVLPMLKWEFFNFTMVSDRVRRRIDAGQSVWDAYLEFHPGKVSILRRLATTQANPAPWRGNLEALLAVLDQVAPEKVPCNDAEWNAFDSICLGLGLNVMVRDVFDRYSSREIHKTIKRRWLVDSSRMGWIAAYQKFAAIDGGTDAIRDTFDFLDAIGNAGDYLALQSRENDNHPEQNDTTAERWLKAPQTFGMFRLVEWSARWHRMLWEDAGISGQIDKQLDKWPLLLPERVQLSPSVQAVSLGNSSALAAEGQRMQHCVGSYSTRCFLGECHIISLRDAENRSLSTLEIAPDKYNNRYFYIRQHKSYGNRTPEPSLKSLEGNLLSVIQKTADFKALAARRKKAETIYSLLKPKYGRQRTGFGQAGVDRISAVMGQDRLIRLFQSGVRS